MSGDGDDLGGLAPLREVVAAHSLSARKSLGQHFLFDLNLTDKVARLAGDLTGVTVIEVGPGPGGLTRSLLKAGARSVVAVEKDARFCAALEELTDRVGDRLQIARADALTCDERELLKGVDAEKTRIVANLPYNVGTLLLIKWLSAEPRFWSRLVLMFQKEVAERITARPGDGAYGRLAVLASARASPSFGFDVPARAFTPPPKVDSAVVRLDPRPDPYDDVAALETLTAAAFGQRRKMLRRSLKSAASAARTSVEALLDAAGLAGDARPETVSPEGFCALADAWRRARYS